MGTIIAEKLDSIQNEMKQLKAECDDQIKEMEDSKRQSLQLSDDELKAKSVKIIALESSIEDLKGDNDDLLTTQEQLNETLDSYEAEIEELKEKTARNSQSEEGKQQIETLTAEKNELLSKLLHLETQNNEMKH